MYIKGNKNKEHSSSKSDIKITAFLPPQSLLQLLKIIPASNPPLWIKGFTSSIYLAVRDKGSLKIGVSGKAKTV